MARCHTGRVADAAERSEGAASGPRTRVVYRLVTPEAMVTFFLVLMGGSALYRSRADSSPALLAALEAALGIAALVMAVRAARGFSIVVTDRAVTTRSLLATRTYPLNEIERVDVTESRSEFLTFSLTAGERVDFPAFSCAGKRQGFPGENKVRGAAREISSRLTAS